MWQKMTKNIKCPNPKCDATGKSITETFFYNIIPETSEKITWVHYKCNKCKKEWENPLGTQINWGFETKLG
jgi:hypothetical protein